jgi:predicted RNA methylase
MDLNLIIGILSGVIAFSSYFFYIPSIIKGKTKPNRASWWIWGIIGTLIAVSYYASGARTTIWVPISEALGPAIIALLSLKYGEGGWTRFDKLCLTGAMAGTLFWWLTDSSEVGLIAYLFVDFTAVMPTIRKSFYRPENEDRNAWATVFFGQVLNLFAVERYIFFILVYPVYMVLTNGIIFFLQFKKSGSRAFSSIDIVSQCLVDMERTLAFEKAIKENVRSGDTVLDAGTGSGILSLFAARSGAKMVVAIELDPFIAKAAREVVKANNYEDTIEVRVADICSYEFEPELKFDVVIVEMLTTGMVDEYQISTINNLHKKNPLTANTRFLPYKQDTYFSLGNFNFKAYGFNIPFIRHLWPFHKSQMKEYRPLTQSVLLNSITFSNTNDKHFTKEFRLVVAEAGRINSLYLSSITHLTPKIQVGESDAMNGAVIVPLNKLHVRKGQEITVSISYNFGGGYESLLAKIKT